MPSDVKTSNPSLSSSNRPAEYTWGREIKSASVDRPCASVKQESTPKGVLNTKQIKVKNKYVDLKTLSYDDLVEMLENLGVKTRVQTQEVTTTKDAGIRVQK